MRNTFVDRADKETTWTANVVHGIFFVCNLFALMPSILIIISVVGFKRMRTVDNLLVLQISVVDALYASMALVWFPIKMVLGKSVLTFTACQLEGAISVLCKVTWLYSATVCAFWRYYTIVRGGRMTSRSMVILQLSQWALPLFAAVLISTTGRFDVMPSGGYCYLRYRDDDWLLLAFYYVNIVIIFVPTCFAIYFYFAITSQFQKVVQRMSDCESDNHLVPQKSDKVNHLQDSPSQEKYRAVAFRAVIYCVVFVLAFLPFGVTMITELALGKSRGAVIDTIVVSAVMSHKVLSPIVTLLVNASILSQVRHIIGI